METQNNDVRINYENEILALADEMAEAVTDFNPQTYYTFLSSRERLKTKIHTILTEYIK